MKLNLIKNVSRTLSKCSMLVLFACVFLTRLAFAVDSLENPSLSMIGPIIGRIFNTALYAAGVVLVVMVAYGVWKSAMAMGDPRALEGAKSTWTYALYGFFVIVLFFTLFMIIAGWFGITSLPNPGLFITNAFSALEELVSVPAK